MSRIVAVVVALSMLMACSAPPLSTALACGPATTLVPHPTAPELTGAPLGPLLIRGPYPSGAKDATVLGFVRGREQKMLVLVARNMDSDIVLTGARCSDGQPLRFWLNKGGGGIWIGGPSRTPVPDDVMATTGDLRAVLPRIDAIAPGTSGYGGYILFPTAGAYRIEALAGDLTIGEATIVVSEEPFPAGQ